jgi:hypothetical protein
MKKYQLKSIILYLIYNLFITLYIHQFSFGQFIDSKPITQRFNPRWDEKQYVNFTNGSGIQYVISYENEIYKQYNTHYYDNCTIISTNYYRSVFLYKRIDCNVWKIVSDTIQTDYKKQIYVGDVNYHDYATISKIYDINLISAGGFSDVYQYSNGYVLILLGQEYDALSPVNKNDWVSGDNADKIAKDKLKVRKYYYNNVLILIPNGNDGYNISIFEPINKETRVPDLKGEQIELMSSKSSIGIKIYKHIRVADGKGDFTEVQQKQDMEGTEKVSYNIEKFATLNFSIKENDIYYSGDYPLKRIK